MISRIVVLDRRVMRIVYDDTHRGSSRSCVKFNQTAVVVVKDSVRS